MKVLIVNNNPEGKGTFWRCFGLAKYLSKIGYEVTLICLQKEKSRKISRKEKDKVTIICLPCQFNWGMKELPGHIYRTFYIISFVLRQNFELIHIFNAPFLMCGFSAFFLKLIKNLKIKNYKLIIDWDDLWGKGGLTDWKEMGGLVVAVADFLETKIPLLADKVTVVSNEINRRAVIAGVNPGKIVKIINGADPETIKPINKFDARKRLGLNPELKIICYAAASVTFNYKFVLSSFTEVAKKVENVLLIFLTPLKEFEKKQILDSDFGNKTLLVDFKPYDDYLLFLAASDVLLMPRSSHLLDKCEFPGRLGDFMASGRPIVTNRAGDIWKIIEETKCGLAANVDDPVDYGNKILKIILDPLLAKKMSLKGRKAAVGSYSWKEIVKILIEKVYETR